MSRNKSNGIILDVERKQLKIKFVYAFIYAILIFVSLAILLSILWILLSSLKDTKEFLQIPPTFLPKNWNFAKFIHVWKKSAIDNITGEASLKTVYTDVQLVLKSNIHQFD